MSNLPNFHNQTIWTADNLDVMRGMNSACVDLIYLDPPFNSGQEWAAPIGSEAAGAPSRTVERRMPIAVAVDHLHGMC